MEASSELQRTTDGEFRQDSQRPSATSWGVAHRVIFRLMFSFLALVIFPFPFNSFGGSLYQVGFCQ